MDNTANTWTGSDVLRVSRRCAAVLLIAIGAVTAVAAGETRYVYDDLGRVIRVERSDGTVLSYTYDAAGNILHRSVLADSDHDGVGNGTDCAPSNPDVYPDAPEINDGVDNQCPGDPGHGIVDEVAGTCGFFDALDPSLLSWEAQRGATVYEVAQATSPDFSDGCQRYYATVPELTVDADPAVGTTYYYLIRSVAPFVGSWGMGPPGVERTGICP